MPEVMRNSVKAIILRERHLLVTVNRDIDGGEFYILPGGGQDFGETLHEALRRECMEEIGTDVEIGELIFVRDYIGSNHEFSQLDGHVHQIEFMFLCTLPDGQTPSMGCTPDTRQAGVKWVHLSELETAPFYPAALRSQIRELSSTICVYLGDVN